jgi:hypothetical protein
VQAARASFATAYFDEQRRKQADARVPFLLVSFLWARKEKTLAEGRNKSLKQSTQPSKKLPIPVSLTALYLLVICFMRWSSGIRYENDSPK